MPLARRVGIFFVMAALAVASQARALEPKLLPGDTEVLITVNVQQILNSELVKANKEAVEQAKGMLLQNLENSPAKKYFDKAGIDVFRDLVSVTIANDGSKDVEKNLFVIVQGKFDVEKFQTTMDELSKDVGKAFKIHQAGNFRLLEINPPDKDKTAFAALVGNSYLVMSPQKDTVVSAVERVQKSKLAELKPAVKTVLQTVSDKQSFSLVASGPALSKLLENAPVPNADAAANILQQVEALSIGVTLTKDIQFQLGVSAKDDETAKKLAAGGNLALLTVRTLVAQKAKEDPNLTPVVDIANTLRITSQGSNFVLRGEVTMENIEALKKNPPNIKQ